MAKNNKEEVRKAVLQSLRAKLSGEVVKHPENIAYRHGANSIPLHTFIVPPGVNTDVDTMLVSAKIIINNNPARTRPTDNYEYIRNEYGKQFNTEIAAIETTFIKDILTEIATHAGLNLSAKPSPGHFLIEQGRINDENSNTSFELLTFLRTHPSDRQKIPHAIEQLQQQPSPPTTNRSNRAR